MTTTYRASGEKDLEVSVDVYDETLGLTYSVDVPIYNVPYEGRETRTPATYFDPPESDGEINLDISDVDLFALFEEQDDGALADDGLLVLETPRTLAQVAAEVLAEAEVDWDVDEPDYED